MTVADINGLEPDGYSINWRKEMFGDVQTKEMFFLYSRPEDYTMSRPLTKEENDARIAEDNKPVPSRLLSSLIARIV